MTHKKSPLAIAVLLASLPLAAVAVEPNEPDAPQAVHDKTVANSPVGDPSGGQAQTVVDTANIPVGFLVAEDAPFGAPQPFQLADDGIAEGVAGAPDGPFAEDSDPGEEPPRSDVKRDRFDSANVFMDNGDAVSNRLIGLSPDENPIKGQMQEGRDTVVGFARDNIVGGINNGAGAVPGANFFWSQTTTNTTPPNGMKAGEDAFATFVDQGVFGAVNGVINLPEMAAGGETEPTAYQAAIVAIPTAVQIGANAALFAFDNPEAPDAPVVADGGVSDAILLTASGTVPGAADTCFFESAVASAGVNLDFDTQDSYLEAAGASADATISVLCGDKDDANKALRLSTAAVGNNDQVGGTIGGEDTTFTLLAEGAPLAAFALSDFEASNEIALSATYDKASTAGRKGGLVAFNANQFLYVRVE